MWDDDMYIRKLDYPLKMDNKMPLADWITYNKDILLPVYEMYKFHGGKMNYLELARSEYFNHYRNYSASFWYKDFDEVRRNIKKNQTLSFSEYLIKHRQTLADMWEDHKKEKNRIVFPEMDLYDKEQSFLEYARWVYNNISDMIDLGSPYTERQEPIDNEKEIEESLDKLFDLDEVIDEEDRVLKPKSHLKRILMVFVRSMEVIFALFLIVAAIRSIAS